MLGLIACGVFLNRRLAAMLSFMVALLQTDPQQHKTEDQLKERAVEVFGFADSDRNGKLTKQEMYNYLADVRVRLVLLRDGFKLLGI